MQIGKTAENAIAVVSYLAESHHAKAGRVSSQAVADARRISKPLAAKILTTLSQSGIVRGSTGPGGGYELEKNPQDIRLIDVVKCFELQSRGVMCPFGKDWCGQYEPCPMHNQIIAMEETMRNFLTQNHFGDFADSECSSVYPGKPIK